jgi:hypothetical protein
MLPALQRSQKNRPSTILKFLPGILPERHNRTVCTVTPPCLPSPRIQEAAVAAGAVQAHSQV